MKYITIFLIFFSFALTSTAQDFSLNYTYKKAERSKDSNQQHYTFTIEGHEMTYFKTTKGRNASAPVNRSVELSDEDLKELMSFLREFPPVIKVDESVDGYSAIRADGNISLNGKVRVIEMTCGAEDQSEERELADKLFHKLKSLAN